MPNLKRHEQELLDLVNQFAPFCHGTSSYSAEIIEKEGIQPRKITGQPSVYKEAMCPSYKDRIYFASIKKTIGACLGAMEEATLQCAEADWLDGQFFVLEKVPEELVKNLTFDEDCRIYDPSCDNAVASLNLIGSFAIKGKIPKQYLKKMSPKEFYHYAKELAGLEDTWEKFITARIEEKEGKGAVEWMKKHYPKLFEDIKKK